MFLLTSTFAPALPEMFVLSMGCFILLLDLFVSKYWPNIVYWLVQLT